MFLIFAYDNNCLYWIENKLFLFLFYLFILWRIFSQTGIFAGFSLHIINLAVRISAAAMAGDITFFSLAGPVGDYTGAHRL